MTLLSDRITATTRARRCAYSNNCCRGIISHLAQINANKKESTTPLVSNLEMQRIFKDEDREEEVNVTDFIR